MSESPDILETLKAEYFALAHAVQTGVKSTMEHDRAHHPARDQDRDEYGAKHLRTGVNMAICEHSALVRIMLDKGLITQIEYYTELNKVLREEVANYEQNLSERFGGKVKLR